MCMFYKLVYEIKYCQKKDLQAEISILAKCGNTKTSGLSNFALLARDEQELLEILDLELLGVKILVSI